MRPAGYVVQAKAATGTDGVRLGWFIIMNMLAAAVLLVTLLYAAHAVPVAHAPQDPPLGLPVAVVDLRSQEGARLVHGQWRVREAGITDIDFRGPGPDLKASGAPLRTHDLVPKAGAADFDDSGWESIAAETLDTRRSSGRLSFEWYRTTLTIPERVGDLPTQGLLAAVEIVIDDYAEIWVDGKLPLVLGQAGGPLVKGFNAPNRVILTRRATPGQTFHLAILGINGPLSNPPHNFIWVRSATLDFYKPYDESPAVGRILRQEAGLDAIAPTGTRIEKLADGFQFTEGPVWVRDGGYLLFSDPNANTIYRYDPDGNVSIFRVKSGYSGIDIGRYHQPGSNGLALDKEGHLTINQHGNRRVVRLEKNGQLTVLADRFNGKRLNSPNDLVYKSDGSLYITDPPFGLPKAFSDPQKEIPYSGVYRVKDGQVSLQAKDLRGPNGIAFSPDEKYLYVSNWDPAKKVIMRYPVKADGALGPGRVFYDMANTPGAPVEDALDGIKIDQAGNLYAVGPLGIWILSQEGKFLGRIELPEHVANCAWGDEDGRSLYITASTGLYRVRLSIAGASRVP